MLYSQNSTIDLRERSPLSLAFVGDGVLELLVRARLVETSRKSAGFLHKQAVSLVSAKGQFASLSLLEPMLTPQEQGVVRRGKNAHKATVSKHATPQEYSASTGLEALFGWLYLQNNNSRIQELFETIWQNYCETQQKEEGER